MKPQEAFMWGILRDAAYKEKNPALRLAALKLFRDKIDVPENPFRCDELNADIDELEQKIRG
jgi:hypothetical protein